MVTSHTGDFIAGRRNPMRKALVEILRSRFRSLACKARSYQSEPLTRVEMWLGVITLYLVLSACLMGHFSGEAGAAETQPVVPVSNRA